jgi:polysaccharide biosynthesis protein PslJ
MTATSGLPRAGLLAHVPASSWRPVIGALIWSTLLIPPGLYRLPVSGMPMDLEIYRLCLFLLLLLWGASLLADESTVPRAAGIDGSIAFLTLAIGLSFAVNLFENRLSIDPPMLLKAVLYLGAPVALIYVVNSVFRSRDDVEWALKLIVKLGVVAASGGVLERASGYNVFAHLSEFIPLLEYKPGVVGATSAMDVMRIAGPSQHAIAFSVVLGMILPIAIYYTRSASSTVERALYGCAAGLIAVTMFLTGSRTAFVAFMVILAILWVRFASVRRWTIPGLFVLAIVLHFAFTGAIGTLLERLSPGYLLATETGNDAGRVADYPRIVGYFWQRPLLGLGFGSFDPFKYFWVDNEYLVMLVEVGLLGISAFLAFFISAFRMLFRAGEVPIEGVGGLAVSLSASVAVFAVTSFTYDSFGFPQPFNLFFILVALGTVLGAGLREPGWAEVPDARMACPPSDRRSAVLPGDGEGR